MNWKLKSALGATALLLATQAFAQMSVPPGATITVNASGEPRG